MIRSYLTLLLCGLLMCGASIAPVQAQSGDDAEPASPTERARLHFKLGVDFYREHNFRAALIEFKRAYKAAPHYKLLYNLGQASLELQEDSAAIGYFSDYLQGGGGEIADDRKQEVEDNITRLRARLATATITTNQAGAEIYVDDTLMGTSPLAGPIQVSVGRRKFVAIKHGFTDAERVVDVAAGDQFAVDLDFKERAQLDLSKLQVAAPAPVAHAEEGPILSPAAWVGIGTGALAAGAVTVSILTLLAKGSYDDQLKVQTTKAKLQDLRDDAKTKALVSDILWGATIVAAGVTTVLIITDSGNQEQPPTAAAGPSVAVAITPTSLQLHGQF
jgi:hypothetical protein